MLPINWFRRATNSLHNIMYQSTCRLATVTCYSFHLVGKATDHTLPAVRPLLRKECITRTRMMPRMATVHQGQVGDWRSQAQAITRNQNGDQDGYCSPGSGRLPTFWITGHYKNQNGEQDGYCLPGSDGLPTFSSTGHFKNQNGGQDGYCSPGSGRLLTFSSTCHYKGIKKLQKVKERPRLSITIDVLRMPISFLSFGCFGQCDDRMLSAAITLVFVEFLPCGEFTTPNQNAYQPQKHSSRQDVTFYPTMDEAAYMTIRFKHSKTDPFRKGHTVTLHATKTLTCPVQAMRHYLKLRSYHAQTPYFCWRMVRLLVASNSSPHFDVC